MARFPTVNVARHISVLPEGTAVTVTVKVCCVGPAGLMALTVMVAVPTATPVTVTVDVLLTAAVTVSVSEELAA